MSSRVGFTGRGILSPSSIISSDNRIILFTENVFKEELLLLVQMTS